MPISIKRSTSKNKNLIIFIHGLGSNNDDCWKNSRGEHWHDIIAKDIGSNSLSPFSPWSIILFGYSTGSTGRNYAVKDIAKTFLSHMQDDIKDTENIIFVGHSQGGIVSRQIILDGLTNNRQDFNFTNGFLANKNIGLLLLASPSLGSRHAKFLPHPLLKKYNQYIDLHPTSDYLASLNKKFGELLKLIRKETHPLCRFYGHAACETMPMSRNIRFPLGLLIKIIKYFCKIDLIVEKHSAIEFFLNDYSVIPNKSHVEICKPESNSEDVYKLLINLIKKFKPVQHSTNELNHVQSKISIKLNDLSNVNGCNNLTGINDDNLDYLKQALDRSAYEILVNQLHLRSVFYVWDTSAKKKNDIDKIIMSALADIDTTVINCAIELTLVNEGHKNHPKFKFAHEIKFQLNDQVAFLEKYPLANEELINYDFNRHLERLKYIKSNY